MPGVRLSRRHLRLRGSRRWEKCPGEQTCGVMRSLDLPRSDLCPASGPGPVSCVGLGHSLPQLECMDGCERHQRCRCVCGGDAPVAQQPTHTAATVTYWFSTSTGDRLGSARSFSSSAVTWTQVNTLAWIPQDAAEMTIELQSTGPAYFDDVSISLLPGDAAPVLRTSLIRLCSVVSKCKLLQPRQLFGRGRLCLRQWVDGSRLFASHVRQHNIAVSGHLENRESKHDVVAVCDNGWTGVSSPGGDLIVWVHSRCCCG